MSKTSDVKQNPEPQNESDLVWGATGIGRVIGRSATQTHYLFQSGALDGAVAKLGHKTIVGSRSKLRNLPFQK